MNQLLRYLIIVSLIPSFLCFAQESANKTTSSSSAQKPETEIQKTNSDKPPKIPELPPAFRDIQPVGLSPEANAWAVQINTRGGFSGKGIGNMVVTSQGYLNWDEKPVKQCQVKLRDNSMQLLSQTALSANTSSWKGIFSEYCADCIIYELVLKRREMDGSEKIYIAYWDNASESKMSNDVRIVYETFIAYKRCKQ